MKQARHSPFSLFVQGLLTLSNIHFRILIIISWIKDCIHCITIGACASAHTHTHTHTYARTHVLRVSVRARTHTHTLQHPITQSGRTLGSCCFRLKNKQWCKVAPLINNTTGVFPLFNVWLLTHSGDDSMAATSQIAFPFSL